jgi:uncharacterized membrane protein
MKKESIGVKDMIMTGLWIAVVTVVTMSVAIPIPLTQGYVNLGDSAVFLGVYFLGRRNGVIAAGIGSALADILVGYAAFSPFTLIIKALMAFIFGSFLGFSSGKIKNESKKLPVSSVIGIGLSVLVLAGGYYLAEWIISGNSTAPLFAIPWNILQGMVGGGIALVLIAGISGIRMPKKESKAEKSPVQGSVKPQTQEPVEEVEAEIVSPEKDEISK